MNSVSTLALLASSSEASDGNAALGFILLFGIILFIGWLFESKPKGVDFQTTTRGTIKPRK